MDNLIVYNAVRTPPPQALKEIKGGRMAGKTDINPMWRLKVLTEQFGMCGVGWKYVIDRQWIEDSPNKERAAFVNISLYIKVDGEWSAAIPGTGGSSFAANEKNGVYTSDECFKMALTDAISVSCKALGVAADVYWEKDPSKYDGRPENPPKAPKAPPPPPQPPEPPTMCPKCGNKSNGVTISGKKITGAEFVEKMGMCSACHIAEKAADHG